jgi:hypothetical protein
MLMKSSVSAGMLAGGTMTGTSAAGGFDCALYQRGHNRQDNHAVLVCVRIGCVLGEVGNRQLAHLPVARRVLQHLAAAVHDVAGGGVQVTGGGRVGDALQLLRVARPEALGDVDL